MYSNIYSVFEICKFLHTFITFHKNYNMIKLGLDLGVGSLGWALIEEIEEGRRILGMGSRVIPLSVDEIKDFT